MKIFLPDTYPFQSFTPLSLNSLLSFSPPKKPKPYIPKLDSRGARSRILDLPWLSPQISPPSPPLANPSPPNVNVPQTLLDPSRTTTLSPSSTPIHTLISSTPLPQSSAFPIQSPYTSHGVENPNPSSWYPFIAHSPPKTNRFSISNSLKRLWCGCSDCTEFGVVTITKLPQHLLAAAAESLTRHCCWVSRDLWGHHHRR